jgi:hypothetical protein
MAAVIVKKEEKVADVLSKMHDISDLTEFKTQFKKLYPKEWQNIIKTYNDEIRRDKKDKGVPMPEPEQYLTNAYNVGLKKWIKAKREE